MILKKIFITGANGYIGKRLTIKILEKGHSVTGAVRQLHGSNSQYFRQVLVGDISICNKWNDTKTNDRLKKYYNLYKNKSFGKNLLKNLKKEMIYKCDIYSLGRTLEDLYELLKIKNEKILALIQNMTEFNHEKRFSIEQCMEFSN